VALSVAIKRAPSRQPDYNIVAIEDISGTHAAPERPNETSRETGEAEEALRAAQKQIEAREKSLGDAQAALEAREKSLGEARSSLEAREKSSSEARAALEAREKSLSEAQAALKEREKAVSEGRPALEARQKSLSEAQAALKEREKALSDAQAALKERENSLSEARSALEAREKTLSETQASMKERDDSLSESQTALKERDKALNDAQQTARAAEDALRNAQADLRGLQQTLLDTQEALRDAQDQQREAQAALQAANARLAQESATDALTVLPNRRTFSRRGEQAANALRQSRKPYGLILLDVDNFKQVNEEYGHDVGDDVLRTLGNILSTQLRNSSDMAARLGGDEFAVLCFGDINEQTLHDVAERIHGQIGKAPLATPKGLLRFTGSFGLALSIADDPDWKSVYGRADAALREAKHAGKDRISFGRSSLKNVTARLRALSSPPAV